MRKTKLAYLLMILLAKASFAQNQGEKKPQAKAPKAGAQEVIEICKEKPEVCTGLVPDAAPKVINTTIGPIIAPRRPSDPVAVLQGEEAASFHSAVRSSGKNGSVITVLKREGKLQFLANDSGSSTGTQTMVYDLSHPGVYDPHPVQAFISEDAMQEISKRLKQLES